MLRFYFRYRHTKINSVVQVHIISNLIVSADNPQEDYFVSTECGHLFHFYCLKAAFDSGYKE